LIIHIYFYKTFSIFKPLLKVLVLVLHSLDTLSDIGIKTFTLLFKLRLCLLQTQAYFAWCFFFLL